MRQFTELDLIKLLLVSILAYQENFGNIIKGEKLDILNYITVQTTVLSIALSKLYESGIDVNKVKSIDELLEIVNK